ncbi:MAG TPA: PaaI family thioesterase [Croceicoccus sp.]|nr:PaaI family thioesterase [Croceicoccus sp.]
MHTERDPIFDHFDEVLSPGGRSLGAELLEYDKVEMRVRMSFDMTSQFTNILGNVHGGYVAAMLDEVAGMAAKLTLPLTKAVPTLSFNVTFLAPAPVGRIIGEGRVIKLGRTTAVLEARVMVPDGKVVALMTVTAAVIDIA